MQWNRYRGMGGAAGEAEAVLGIGKGHWDRDSLEDGTEGNEGA